MMAMAKSESKFSMEMNLILESFKNLSEHSNNELKKSLDDLTKSSERFHKKRARDLERISTVTKDLFNVSKIMSPIAETIGAINEEIFEEYMRTKTKRDFELVGLSQTDENLINLFNEAEESKRKLKRMLHAIKRSGVTKEEINEAKEEVNNWQAQIDQFTIAKEARLITITQTSQNFEDKKKKAIHDFSLIVQQNKNDLEMRLNSIIEEQFGKLKFERQHFTPSGQPIVDWGSLPREIENSSFSSNTNRRNFRKVYEGSTETHPGCN